MDIKKILAISAGVALTGAAVAGAVVLANHLLNKNKENELCLDVCDDGSCDCNCDNCSDCDDSEIEIEVE